MKENKGRHLKAKDTRETEDKQGYDGLQEEDEGREEGKTGNMRDQAPETLLTECCFVIIV